MLVQDPARLGGADPARPAVEQGNAQVGFQQLDLIGDSRLRHVQPGGGPIETALFHNGDEAFELSKFHCHYLPG